MLIVGPLVLSSGFSYLLFHTLAEMFSVVIGCGIFVIAWNARRLLQNNYLLFLGIAFLSIAALDLAHTLVYKGMGVIPQLGTDPPTQLWIAARATQAVSLMVAPLLLGRRVRAGWTALGYGVFTTLILLSVFTWKIFPSCHVEGTGLTAFKRISEYVICLVLAVAMVLLYRRRSHFDPQVLRLLLWSAGLTIASELAFTSYIDVYGPFNLVGHILKIGAFFLVYKALIETGIAKPHSLLLRQLSQSEERYRLLFDTSPDAIFSMDISGRFVMVNPACEILSGYSRQELLGRTVMSLCAPDQRSRTMDEFKRNLRQPKYTQFETALVRKDGSRAEIWLVGKPLFSEGRLAAFHCTARDIGDRKRFQAELETLVRERTSKLRELVAELEHFSYTLTHDMRAPLRAMHGFGSLLMEKAGNVLDPESRGFLHNIMNAALRMDRLITDALHFSQASMKELSLHPVDPNPLLQGIIESYPGMQPPKADIQVAGNLPWVVANEAGLTQCFSNLLGNAIKFVEPGKMPKVRIRAEIRDEADAGPLLAGEGITAAPVPGQPLKKAPAGPVVRIWIEDNGIGIPSSFQHRVFEMFQRLSKTYEGTGVGLALVRKVVHRMNGRVGVESDAGKGSRFWLEFPCAKEAARPPARARH